MNCRANLELKLVGVSLKNKDEVLNSLVGLLEMDADLSENEEYFREDTLLLGYESEAHRIVAETILEKGYPSNGNEYNTIATEIFSHITNQEYFGECSIEMIELGSKMIIAYAYGGSSGI